MLRAAGDFGRGFDSRRLHRWLNGAGRLFCFGAPGLGVGDSIGETHGVTFPAQMLRAVNRQIARFLNWVNRTGSGSSASGATREAADHRRDVESRSGGGRFGGLWGS
jgi:hypothetical protein